MILAEIALLIYYEDEIFRHTNLLVAQCISITISKATYEGLHVGREEFPDFL